MNQDNTSYSGYPQTSCSYPYCQPGQCPHCGRLLSPWEPIPYVPIYPNYPSWQKDWTATIDGDTGVLLAEEITLKENRQKKLKKSEVKYVDEKTFRRLLNEFLKKYSDIWKAMAKL